MVVSDDQGLIRETVDLEVFFGAHLGQVDVRLVRLARLCGRPARSGVTFC